jgi:hypothetical protein
MPDVPTETPAEQAPPHTGRIEDYQRRIDELAANLQQRTDELAAAEAMRDEANSHLTTVENRLAAQRRMGAAGVIDLDAASDLLARRIDMSEPLDVDAVNDAVDRLLLDKPFLRRPEGSLPPASASARDGAGAAAGRLADAAQRAARSGDRKDVAEYLRLRRQASPA